MKKLKIATLLFTISMFLITCKKEHIQPSATNGTPVFYFNGTVNGSQVSLDAGVSSYYMYSSYTQSSGGLYSFIGNLQQVSSNKSSIEFIINDYRVLSAGGSETNMTAALDTGSYNYFYSVGGTPTQDSVLFTPSWGTVQPISYTYNFGDGNTLSGTTAPAKFTHLYAHPGNYTTSLSVVFDTSHNSSLSNRLIFNNTPIPFSDTISERDSLANPIVTYTCTPKGGSGTYSFLWNFGDPSSGASNTATGGSVTHTFIDTANPHNVSVMVTDAANDTVITYCNSGSSASTRKYLINYTMVPVPVSNPNGFSNVIINYTDPTGHKFTSQDSVQHGGSNFKIVSVSNYQNNENNQTTKMLHVKFNCMLYDSAGSSITIKNGDAVIAVAYK